VGYALAGTLRRGPAEGETRLLTPADAPHVERLGRACTADEWDDVASLSRAAVSVGAFRGWRARGCRRIRDLGDTIAHVAVLTHPAHRGCALGSAVVSGVAALALERGLVPQYRSLMANRASRALAAALGFEHYATSLALRFTPSPAA